jgi:hypothetical protein
VAVRAGGTQSLDGRIQVKINAPAIEPRGSQQHCSSPDTYRGNNSFSLPPAAQAVLVSEYEHEDYNTFAALARRRASGRHSQ